MQVPTLNRVTQGRHGNYNAVDYSASPDPTIYAPEDGKITAYGASGTCGNRLELTAGGNRHGFCHLERPLVKVGQIVKRGQAIGIMGYTGYTIPSGPAGRHLHWVISRGGVYVYPPSLVNEAFIKQGSSSGGQIMDNDTKVKNQYYTLRGNYGTVAERQGWIGKSYEEFNAKARAEVDSREAHRRNLENALNVVTKERDAARATAAKITKELATTRDEIKKLDAQILQQGAEIDGLKKTQQELEAQHQAQLKEIEKVIAIKDSEIDRLTSELAKCDENTPKPDCSDLSGVDLIILGIKKLFGKE